MVGVPRVSVDDHFFDDLGADSMVMARFCARVRKRPDLPSVSMKDIYAHPTIRELATAMSEAAPATCRAERHRQRSEVAKPAGTVQYVFCGVLQLLVFLGYSYLSAIVLVQGFEWVSAGTGLVDVYLRSALFGGAGFLGHVPPSDPGQVAAHRSVEAAADPHLELGVRPLLGRQDAGPVEPAGPVRRFTDLQPVSAGARARKSGAAS